MEVCWENNRTKRVVFQQAMFDQRVVWSVQTRIVTVKPQFPQKKGCPKLAIIPAANFATPYWKSFLLGITRMGTKKSVDLAKNCGIIR